jgi:hypothetical protein
MSSTRKTEKSANKQSNEKPTTGRVNTIAKARPTPVTGAPKGKPVAVLVGNGATAATPLKTKAHAAIDTAEHKVDEIVVFAFRMLRSERDELHAATGSAKASRFVRAIVLAGARGDMKAIEEIVDEVEAGRK